jgi:hypothetical protein
MLELLRDYRADHDADACSPNGAPESCGCSLCRKLDAILSRIGSEDGEKTRGRCICCTRPEGQDCPEDERECCDGLGCPHDYCMWDNNPEKAKELTGAKHQSKTIDEEIR